MEGKGSAALVMTWFWRWLNWEWKILPASRPIEMTILLVLCHGREPTDKDW
jgi:predicted small integral membrane protein